MALPTVGLHTNPPLKLNLGYCFSFCNQNMSRKYFRFAADFIIVRQLSVLILTRRLLEQPFFSDF